MNLFKSLFSFLILLANLAIATEDSHLKPESGKTVRAKPINEIQSTFSNLLGMPSCFVAGRVNVITGDYVQHEIDLAIPASTPLTLERTYSSSFDRNGSLSLGWNFNHYKVLETHIGSKKRFMAYLNEGMGAVSHFEGKTSKSETPICSKSLSYGATNYRGGQISGKTNPNNVVLKHNRFALTIREGSGKRDIFDRIPNGSHNQNPIIFTFHPNKNLFTYEYDKHGELATCKLFDSTKQHVGGYTIKRKYSDNNKQEIVEISSSTHQKVSYTIEKMDYDWVLKKVTNTNAPTVTYHYSYTDYDPSNHPRIFMEERPNYQYLSIDYWRTSQVCGNLEIDDSDPRRDCVKFIEEQVGSTHIPIRTYSFKYFPNWKEKYSGYTEVLDAENNKTTYHYNDNQRITKLEFFGNQATPYRSEKFFWGDKNGTNLIAHAIADQKGGVQFIQTFKYDDQGNPLEEHIYGNLTGENTRNPMLDKNAISVETGCEGHVKKCTFGDSFFNLKTSEQEGNKKTTFSYVAGKDQLEAKFVHDQNLIKERHFYHYNTQGMLIKEVTDDGSESKEGDGTDIKERTLYEASTYKDLSFLPEEEKFSYMENGNPKTFKRLFNHYNKYGQLTIQDHHDADDNLRYRLHWLYDAMGNVIEEVNAAGETTYRKYDANKNLIYEKHSHFPYHTNYSYDYMNRLISAEMVDHAKNSYKISHKYDNRNNRISSTDIYGNETKYEYDSFNRLVKTIYPPLPKSSGELFYPTETIEYDVLGYIAKRSNRNGDITVQNATIRGQPYYINYPDGSTEKMIYNLDGTLKEKIDKNGMRSCYTYDYKDRVLTSEFFSVQGESLGLHQYEYSAFHLTKEIDPEGHITNYTYNPQGQLVSLIKEDTRIDYTYDALGRKNSTKTFFGYAETDFTLEVYEYDLRNFLIEERYEDGFGNTLRKTLYNYDAAGNPTEMHVYSDKGIQTTLMTYNCHNQVTSLTDPENNTTYTTYRYDYKDSFDCIVPYSETTDPKGNITIRIYNTHNQLALIQVKNPFNQIIQEKELFYDGENQLIETREHVFQGDTLDRKVITQWNYNALGEIVSCTEASGTLEQKYTQHTFNSFSQKISTHKPDGTIISYIYDDKGRLSRVSSSDNTIDYSYTYNLNDLPIAVEDHVHNTKNIKVYDKVDRLIGETLGNGLTINYVYDRQNRIHSVTIPDKSHVVYTYNATDLTEVKRLNQAGVVMYAQKYQYDLSGQVLQKTLPFDLGDVTYEYDALNRTKAIDSAYFSEKEILYDAVGNLISKTLTDPVGMLPCEYTYDDLYQLDSEDSTHFLTYQYDSVYNRVMKDGQFFDFNSLNQFKEKTYDSNGNLLERNKQSYTYDAWDRLISVTLNNIRFRYIYDDLSRRLSKAKDIWEPLSNSWVNIDEEYYLYQYQDEIGMCDKQKNLVEFRTLGKGLGAEIGAAVALEIQGQTYIPISNSLGSIQILINDQGKSVDIYRYTAFGEETILDNSGKHTKPKSNWRYCSKRFDPETGLIYFGNRYYDPQEGRWITSDPLSYEAGPNLYAYVNNNPLTRIDAYGLYFELAYSLQNEKKSDPNVVKGSVHGAVDFVVSTFQDLHKSVSYIGVGELDFHDKAGAILSIEGLHNRQMEYVEKTMMGIFNVDPSNEAYQSARYYSRMGLEVASLAVGTYGAAKSGFWIYNNAFKTTEKITKFEYFLHKFLSTPSLSPQKNPLEFTFETSSCKNFEFPHETPIYTFTGKVKKQMEWRVQHGRYKYLLTRPYINSPHTISEIMLTGEGIPDLYFKGGLNWKVDGSFRGSNGIWELGINPETNIIYHFNFVDKPK